MKSIIQNEKECFVCHRLIGLHEHHIYEGTANRKISEKYGMKIWLCPFHHNMSNEGIHFNKELDLSVKQYAQEIFEQTHTREEFRSLFGKSYL